MKFLTKEWYELMQKTSYHLGLEEEPRAEKYSERLYEEVYSQELEKWLELHQQIDLLSQADEISQPLHADQEAVRFREIQLYKQEMFRRSLPSAILNQIADLRVFALEKASASVISALTQFCEENHQLVQKASEQYIAFLHSLSTAIERELLQNFSFHDCVITGVEQNEQAFTIHLDPTGGFTDICKVTFEDYVILELDGNIQGAWWLYEEVYPVNDSYEFHALLQSPHAGLTYLTISAKNANFTSN
ncbi:hypothetical protein E6C60_2288 [Paenibacillus algicola]|uniref:DUF4085 family protein n=1 Tax=Paenibacillus algicola TaxID=2565926 RepID=A0A4P8XMT1_9BACL|nr:DUF4085 family protein [Paenibacillus algicola]QCT03000.1 hypothetical protein E6C60_2288 [Paenibacillus algicola]